MKITLQKPDIVGALASTLCLIHCLITPVFFAAQSYTVINYEDSQILWKSLDFLFVSISFFAVYRSSQNTSSTFIKYALWISWVSLFFLILNEKIQWISLPEIIIYISAITLAILHIYNLKYCQCNNDACCTKH